MKIINIITKASMLLLLFAAITGKNSGFIPVTGMSELQSSFHIKIAEANSERLKLEESEFRPQELRIEDKFTLKIANQPEKDLEYVTMMQGVVTSFRLAEEYGSVGLLAHNFLAGDEFSNIEIGDQITVHGDGLPGNAQKYIVHRILSFQALNPESAYSYFKNLDNGEVVSAPQLFKDMYGTADHLTLQTCIEKDGDLVWGRLFIIAQPI